MTKAWLLVKDHAGTMVSQNVQIKLSKRQGLQIVNSEVRVVAVGYEEGASERQGPGAGILPTAPHNKALQLTARQHVSQVISFPSA